MTSLAPVLDGKVLIAEDDPEMRAMLRALFLNAGIEVDLVADGTQLQDRLFDGHAWLPEVLVSDVEMPGASGLAVLQRLQECDADVRVVLITALGEARTHRRAHRLGAVAVLDKPFDIRVLLDVVSRLLDESRSSDHRPTEEDLATD